MTINGKTEEEILRDFFELVAQKEWFQWIDEPEVLGYHTQIQVDEILTEDFEEEIHESRMMEIATLKFVEQEVEKLLF